MIESDIVVVGGGIVGLATALALQRLGYKVIVVEAEDKVAVHQSGHNSGVIHSGLYYKPGSLKAKLCAEGREMMFEFCEDHGIEAVRCGKLVVATNEDEVGRLDGLLQRARENGLVGVRRVDGKEMREIEPVVGGICGLFVPETGKTDFVKVCAAMASDLSNVRTSAKFLRARVRNGWVYVQTSKFDVECNLLVNCAGLQSDRVALKCGVKPSVRIIPFRGEYWGFLRDSRGLTNLVRHLIYPVPDPRFPFLGAHFLKKLDGGVTAGPNAILGFARDDYGRLAVSWGDVLDFAKYSGFWNLVLRNPLVGIREIIKSFSRNVAAAGLCRLVPGIRAGDLVYDHCGIRAQAVFPNGQLADDFVVEECEGMVHVLNAPSPGATASLAIGEYIAGIAGRQI